MCHLERERERESSNAYAVEGGSPYVTDRGTFRAEMTLVCGNETRTFQILFGRRRARAIYAYAAQSLGREAAPELHKQYLAFEKKHGSVSSIEAQIASKRRTQRRTDYTTGRDLRVRLAFGECVGNNESRAGFF